MIARAKRFSIPPRPCSVPYRGLDDVPKFVTELHDPASKASAVLFGVCFAGFVLVAVIAWVLA